MHPLNDFSVVIYHERSSIAMDYEGFFDKVSAKI